jgi:cation transport ATPase
MTTLTVALLAISFRAPFYLSDSNSFLRDFVNHEFLAILGFIVALTLGFAGNIHLELNRLEDETGNAFRRTRAAVKRSAISLMAAFIVAGALVVIKPMLIQEPIYAAVANSIAIVIVFFNLAVLYDLSETVFGIPTVKKIKESQNAKL